MIRGFLCKSLCLLFSGITSKRKSCCKSFISVVLSHLIGLMEDDMLFLIRPHRGSISQLRFFGDLSDDLYDYQRSRIIAD
jgi:hypothetical protein